MKTSIATFLALLFLAIPSIGQAQFTYSDNGDGTCTIIDYNGPGGAVALPTNINGLVVTIVGDNLFYGYTNLTSVTIPYGVTSIEDGAFYGCTSLTNVIMPASVTSLGQYALYGNGAFSECTSLMSVTIPGSVTNIGYGLFYGCTGLTNVIISNGVTSLGELAFFNCHSLTSVAIPTSVINIEGGAFDDCTGLTNVTIPAGVSSIGDSKFYGCTSLINVTIPVSVTNIGQGAFASTGLTNIAIPASVTGVGDFVFDACTALTNAIIPQSITSLPSGLFADATNLTSVYFQGNAPSVTPSGLMWEPVFAADDKVTVYYLPSTTGWSNTYQGVPAVLWNPMIQTNDGHFGIHSNQFGFNITSANSIPIVIEACTSLPNSVWAPLTNVILTNGSFYFSDQKWSNYPHRYYGVGFP